MPDENRAGGEPFRLADCEVRPRLNEIEGPAGIVRLNPRAMDVLCALARRPDRFASKRELLDEVWTDLFVTDEVLTTAIWELRRAFGDEARSPRFLRTVPRRGYQLLPAVEALTPEAGLALDPAVEEVESLPAGAAAHPRGTRRRALGAALAAVVLLGMVAIALVARRSSPGASTPIRALAVLPFTSLGGDPRDRTLADGLTDTLTTSLAEAHRFRVVSRTSVIALGAGARTSREIGEVLGVDAIVEGTLAREGDRIVLNTQLIDTRTDAHLWARSYERRFDALLDLQVEVARTIGAAIASLGDLPAAAPTRLPVAERNGESRLAWRFRTGGEIWSDPVRAGDAVLFGSRDGFLYCVELATGHELWRAHAGEEIATRPLLAGDRAVVATSEGALVAVALATGAELWRSHLPTSVEIAPALAEDRAVVADEAGNVVAFELASGRQLWTARVAESSDGLTFHRGAVVVTDWAGLLTALDPVDGALLWSTSMNERAAANLVAADDLLLVPMADGTLRALAADGGREVWRTALDAPTAAATWRDRIFAAGAHGALVALERQSGRTLWSVEAGGGLAHPAVHDDQVFAGARDRNLWVFDAWSGERRLRVEMQTWILTEPLAAEGLVIFGSLDGSVYALRFPADPTEPLRIRQANGFRDSAESPDQPPEVAVERVAASAIAPTVRWRRRLPGEVIRAPAFDASALYVGAGSSLTAVAQTSGEELWRKRFGGEVTTRPTLAGSRVLIGSRDHSLYSIETADGAEAWRFATRGDVLSSPAVDGGRVFFGSRDGHLYALDAAGGRELWRRQLDVIHAAPVATPAAVYVAARGNQVSAFTPAEGREIWSAATADWAVADLVVAGPLLLVASCDGTIQAFDLSTGEERWRFVTRGEIWFRPLAAGGRLYFGSADFHVYAVDLATGMEAWRFRTGNRALSSVAAWEGLVFVGSYDRTLYALDGRSGQLAWTVRAPGAVASPAASGSNVAFGTSDGSLVLLDLRP